MLNFNDIFKSNFINNASAFSMTDAVIAIVTSLILGLVMYFVHKKTFRGVMYSTSMGLSLIAMSVITSLLIVAVTSNVVLSLGMVGALSIVRFRAAVKDPLDIAFIFWAIAVGIVSGAGFIPLAVFGTIIIALLLLIALNIRPSRKPYIIVVTADKDSVKSEVLERIKTAAKNYAVKSEVLAEGSYELTAEIYIKEKDTSVIQRVNSVEGVRSSTLVSYNGEYMS